AALGRRRNLVKLLAVGGLLLHGRLLLLRRGLGSGSLVLVSTRACAESEDKSSRDEERKRSIHVADHHVADHGVADHVQERGGRASPAQNIKRRGRPGLISLVPTSLSTSARAFPGMRWCPRLCLPSHSRGRRARPRGLTLRRAADRIQCEPLRCTGGWRPAPWRRWWLRARGHAAGVRRRARLRRRGRCAGPHSLRSYRR